MNYTIQKGFTHDGEKYQIRSWVRDEEICVHAFKQDGTRVDHGPFSLRVELQCDAKLEGNFPDPVSELVQIVERRVRGDGWNP